MFIKSAAINLCKLIRFFISAIFILSVFGKLIDHTISGSSLSQLFGLPNTIARTVTISWSLFETVLAALIWRSCISQTILVVPLTLLGVMLFGYWRGIDCGCFGSLPFLSKFSFSAHLLLLGGMFLSLYYLTVTSKA